MLNDKESIENDQSRPPSRFQISKIMEEIKENQDYSISTMILNPP